AWPLSVSTDAREGSTSQQDKSCAVVDVDALELDEGFDTSQHLPQPARKMLPPTRKHQAIRMSPFLPLFFDNLIYDIAAAGRRLRDLRHGAFEGGFNGGIEIVLGHVVWVDAIVHGAHVDHLALLVEDEELGRYGGSQRTADLLAFIV